MKPAGKRGLVECAWGLLFGREAVFEILLFVAGVALCNSIPHLVAGVRGEVFPTLFAKPPGTGPSSPIVNFVWGAVNLFVALAIMKRHPVEFGPNAGCIAMSAGAVVAGLFLAIHFGRWRRQRS